jgi:hypothetical protein
VLPGLPAEPVFPLSLSDDDFVFALAAFALFFFLSITSVCFPFGSGEFDFGRPDDLDAFAKTVVFAVGLTAGFGVGLAFTLGGVVFKTGVAVGFGSGVGKSISLFARVKDGRSFSDSSGFNDSDSMGVLELFAYCLELTSDLSAAKSSSPLSQTRLSASGSLRAAKLHRINPPIRATCASVISVTFRQKRPLGAP